MARKNNNFLEQLQRRREQDASPRATTPEKSPEEMSGEELDEALNRARRDLLDAQHAELKERELAQIQKSAGGEGDGPRTLADVLHAKQRGKHRTWR